MDFATIFAIWMAFSAFNVIFILILFRLVPGGRSEKNIKNCKSSVKLYAVLGPLGILFIAYGFVVSLIEVLVEWVLEKK